MKKQRDYTVRRQGASSWLPAYRDMTQPLILWQFFMEAGERKVFLTKDAAMAWLKSRQEAA
jgi:hypothetical protein